MSEPYEIKKAKIDSLVGYFTSGGYKSNNRIGQSELMQFLNKRIPSGRYDLILSEKLFECLNLDAISTITVEDFINGYLQFEDDIRRNAELFNIKLSQEQEIYANLAEQCRRYKSEKLNSEGLCENAKVYGEITDIDIKRKLEGIKEIIIKVIYNDKSEELHFKIGDMNNGGMLKKSFGFKPSSRKDHFEFIMRGVNDRNQIFDIGSKVFPLTDINSYEEYIVQIVVPEIDNEEQIAAYINAKIVLYWSDYIYYERQRRKAESRLKKLTSAANKAAAYLRMVREMYGDLTRKKPDLIVDFNNEKLMQRKGSRLKVNFNNQKKEEASSGNFLVEFNNQKQIQKSVVEPVKIQVNKEVTIQSQTIKTQTQSQQKQIKEAIKEEQEEQEEKGEQEELEEQEEQEEQEEKEEIEEKKELINENLPTITKVEEENEQVEVLQPQGYQEYMEQQQMQTTQLVNTIPTQETEYSQQIQAESNVVQNGGGQYNINEYYQQIGGGAAFTSTTNGYTLSQNQYENQDQGNMRMAETIGYGTNDNMGGVEAYGTGGYEMIDDNTNLSSNKALFSQNVLPVKVLDAKINKVIVDNNVKTLPVIYNQNQGSYGNNAAINGGFSDNNFLQGQGGQAYNVQSSSYQSYSYTTNH